MTLSRLSTRPVAAVVLVACALLALFATMGSAKAHPLGNFTINRYARLELFSDAIRVHYVVDMAEIPTFQASTDIDTDRDGALSEAELQAYGSTTASSVAGNLDLTVDGSNRSLDLLSAQARLLPGQGGLQVLRIDAVYGTPISAGQQPVALAFTDSNYNDRVGWKEIVVRPSEGTSATISPELRVEQSEALAVYPAETLKSAPDMRSVTLEFVPGTGATAPIAVLGAPGIEREPTESGFASLINKDTSSAWVIFLSLLAAFGFGMLHALGPGHGKTVVAAYLVGSKGTVRHAVALGATVTATHTSTVYIVGFISLAASSQFATEKVQLYIGVAAGLMIIAMGLSLFTGRLIRHFRRTEDDGMHRHGFFGSAHSHMPVPQAGSSNVLASTLMPSGGAMAMQPRVRSVVAPAAWGAPRSNQGHAHSHGGHAHSHGSDAAIHSHAAVEAPTAETRVTWKSLLTLGVAGGLLPCPSAIVVMISAIALGKVAFGMLLIVAFSLGLAGVLTAIGIGLVLGKRLSRQRRVAQFARRPVVAKLAGALPIVSAAAVTIAGVGVTLIAVNQAQIL